MGLALRKDGEGLTLLAERFAVDEWVSGDDVVAGELLDVEELPEGAEVAHRLRALRDALPLRLRQEEIDPIEE